MGEPANDKEKNHCLGCGVEIPFAQSVYRDGRYDGTHAVYHCKSCGPSALPIYPGWNKRNG